MKTSQNFQMVATIPSFFQMVAQKVATMPSFFLLKSDAYKNSPIIGPLLLE